MHFRRPALRAPAVACLMLGAWVLAAGPSREALDQAFGRAQTFAHGQDRTPLSAIEAAVDESTSDPGLRAALCARLAALLERPDTTDAARQFACRLFERIGTEAHVPLRSRLLADGATAECARRALESIPGDVAAAALRSGLSRAQGALAVGIINSLGERRDPNVIDLLVAGISGDSGTATAAAVRALGKIGTADALAALRTLRTRRPDAPRGPVEAALLACADRLKASGSPRLAATVYRELLPHESVGVRTAALAGLAGVDVEGALPLLVDGLGADDPRMRGTASRLLLNLSAPPATALIVERLPSLEAHGRVLAIDVLAASGSEAARAAVLELAASDGESVRIAALRALGAVGDAATVGVLASAAATGGEPVRQAARHGLSRLAGPGVEAALIEGAGTGDWRTRVELLNAVVARGIVDAVPMLLAAATDGHHLVRLAAFDGLRQLASPEHYAALVRLLVDAPTVADIRAAQRAALAAARRMGSADAKLTPLLSAAAGVRPEVEVAIVQTAAQYGGDRALAAVAAAADDGHPKVQDAAVRALASWRDDSAVPRLLAILRRTSNSTHRTLALRGCLRLAQAAPARSGATALEWLRQAREAAATLDDKRMFLSAVAGLQLPGALELAASFLADPDVLAEARMATLGLARAMRSSHPKAVESVLTDVLDRCRDPETLRQVNILLGNVKSTPLFDGESLRGWVKPFDWGQATVEEGAIHLRGGKKFFLVSEKTFGDFILELDAWLDEGANSGVQFRSHYEQNSLWGYQADIDSLPRGWRGIYDETPGRGWLNRGDAQKAQGLYRDGWNTYRIECFGDRTRVFMNDELTVDHLDPMEIEGHIALQHHGEDGKVVRFRNIRITDFGRRQWLPLVDEGSLATWQSNGVGAWTVANEVISGRKTGGGHGLLFSPEQHADFCVRFEVKAVRGNAGFYLRSEKRPGAEGAAGLQVEIDPAKDQSGLYETHGRKWVAKPDADVVRKHYRSGDWNEMAVCARGGKVLVYLNGHKTVELKDDTGRKKGYFGLGTHGGDVHVQFRKLRILSD